MDFLSKYPIDLSEVIVTPMIVRESVKEHIDLPAPTLQGIRSLAEYAGFKYGALRTAVTRLKQRGQIRTVDIGGTTRFEMCDFFKHVTRHYTYYRDEDGFTIAVPRTSTPKQRQEISQILCTLGFVKLSTNNWISGKMDTEALLAELNRNGLGGTLFVFNSAPVKDPETLERLKGLWDLAGWEARVREFLEDITGFYRLDGLDDAEVYNRIFYAGPAFFRYIQRDFPRLCEKHFPGRTVYNRITELTNEVTTRYAEQLIRFYLEINK